MKRVISAVAIGLGISLLVLAFNFANAKADTCTTKSTSYTWGVWPYSQTVRDNTYICYKATTGIITYRATNVGASSPFCSSSDNYTYRTAGGVGNYYVEWIDGSHFTCPTNIPWIYVHRDDGIGVEFALTGSLPNPTVVYKIFSHSS